MLHDMNHCKGLCLKASTACKASVGPESQCEIQMPTAKDIRSCHYEAYPERSPECIAGVQPHSWKLGASVFWLGDSIVPQFQPTSWIDMGATIFNTDACLNLIHMHVL